MTRFEMYKVLGVRHGASMEEIKDAYRRLVKKYHPDLTQTAASGLKLGRVIEAYKTLSVATRRRNLVDFPGNPACERKPPPPPPGRPPGKSGAGAGSGTGAGAGAGASGGAGRRGGNGSGGGRGSRTQAAAGGAQREKGDIFSLGKLLETGKTIGMRAFAARSLGNSGKKTAYAFLRKALYDPSDLVVKAAVDAIGNLRISQSYGELSAVYVKGNREIREAVLYCVRKIGVHGGFRDIVENAQRDPDVFLRNTARRMSMETDKAASDG